MILFKDSQVKEKFSTYPAKTKEKLLDLRQAIFDVAKEHKIEDIEETLKWNEPSFLCKSGSTIRINSKESKPGYYSIYFNCKTKLVSTFRQLFPEKFNFIGNREIEFYTNEEIDFDALKYCILLALTYHKRKHLDMLDEE
jgi:hypothetical protein